MCFDLLLPTQLLALMLANIFPGGAFRAGGMEAGTADLEERGVEDAFLPACLDQTPLEPNRTPSVSPGCLTFFLRLSTPVAALILA